MTKCVLVQSSSSIYDDEAGSHYHFPKRYLRRIRETSGDWAVFFSPVRDKGVSPEHRGAYFATAQLGEVTADLTKEDHYYVEIISKRYASFSTPVDRRVNGRFIEPAMQGKDGQANTGVALQAVRHISDEVFAEIVSLAWRDEPTELPRTDELFASHSGLSDEPVPFEFDIEREVVPTLTNRKIRDRRFRHTVMSAYDKKCAITGWTFINGGGRAEVEAAHIKPVEHDGPDSINNGLALSGTIHWMFDRGLVGIARNGEILISRKVNDRESVERLINPSKKLIRPEKREHQPHPRFLEWHRKHHLIEAA